MSCRLVGGDYELAHMNGLQPTSILRIWKRCWLSFVETYEKGSRKSDPQQTG